MSQATSSPTKAKVEGLAAEVEEEVPKDSGEVAYVYAFLHRFRPTFFDSPLSIQTVLDLETALVLPRPIPVSTTQWQPSIEPVLKELVSLIEPKAMKEVGDFLVSFVQGQLGKKESAIRWKHNLLAVDGVVLEGQSPTYRQGVIWELDWKDRAHLLRLLTDHALAYSEQIKAEIKKLYNLFPQKPARRDAASNPFVVQPLGRDRLRHYYYSIDDSPRVYSQAGLFKKNGRFRTVTTTKEELVSFISTLPEPEPLPSANPTGAEADNPFTKAASKPSKKKKKSELVDAREQEERDLRRQLETLVLARLEEGEARVARMEAKRLSSLRRKATAERAQAVAAELAANRTSRLRTTRTRPANGYNEDLEDRKFRKMLKDYNNDEIEEEEEEVRRSKRRRTSEPSEDGDYNDAAAAGAGGSDDERVAGPSRREWRGERRSTRIRMKVDSEPEDDDEGQPRENAFGWSRDPATIGETSKAASTNASMPVSDLESSAASGGERDSSPLSELDPEQDSKSLADVSVEEEDDVPGGGAGAVNGIASGKAASGLVADIMEEDSGISTAQTHQIAAQNGTTRAPPIAAS